MRFPVVLGVALALAGCSSSSKPASRPEPKAETGDAAVQAALDELGTKLATFTPKGDKPAIEVLPFLNVSSGHFDATHIQDGALAKLVESGKFTVLSGPGTADYQFQGKLSDERLSNADSVEVTTRYHFEIKETRTRGIVFVANKVFTETSH